MGYFSNGQEADSYLAKYCDRCVHSLNCEVWDLHFDFNYEECNKPDSFLHRLIPRSDDRLDNKKCSMFVGKSVKEG